MVAEQKRALFTFGVMAVSLAVSLTIGLCLGWDGAWSGMGLLALMVFGYLFRRREKPDERDLSINTCVMAVAGMASFATLVLSCMGVWAVSLWHHQEQISVGVLCSITVAGGWAFYLAHSIAVLVLYNRHSEAENV